MRRIFPASACVLGLAAGLRFAPASAQEAPFIRGDSDLSGVLDLSDAVKTLGVLFLGQPAAGCDDAMDGNDDGKVDISDPLYVLGFLFLGGAAPPPPFPDCGIDPTADPLGCGGHPSCPQVAECFDQAALDQAIAENLPPVVCLEPDAYQFTQDPLTVTVCPGAAAEPCGGPDEPPGCPIAFDSVEGTLDLAAEEVRVSVSGHTSDLPILVSSFAGEVTCLTDIQFSGELVLPFVTGPDAEGRTVVLDILDPILEDAQVDLQSEGGLLCDLLEANQDAFVDDLIEQLETAASQLVVQLEPELIGAELCPVP